MPLEPPALAPWAALPEPLVGPPVAPRTPPRTVSSEALGVEGGLGGDSGGEGHGAERGGGALVAVGVPGDEGVDAPFGLDAGEHGVVDAGDRDERVAGPTQSSGRWAVR